MTDTKRKPYKEEMNASWWKKNEFFKFYMIREATALFSLWFSFELLFFIKSLVIGLKNLDGFDALFTQPFADLNYFINNFLSNPIVMLINFIGLLMACLNTYTYFNMSPKVMPLTYKGKVVKEKTITQALWAVTVVFSFLVLAFFV